METPGSQVLLETGVTEEKPTHFQALWELQGRKESGEPQVSSHLYKQTPWHMKETVCPRSSGQNPWAQTPSPSLLLYSVVWLILLAHFPALLSW